MSFLYNLIRQKSGVFLDEYGLPILIYYGDIRFRYKNSRRELPEPQTTHAAVYDIQT